MKKQFFTLCLCVLMVMSFLAVSAAELPVESVADGISMTPLTYEENAFDANEDITIKISARRLAEVEDADKIILLASLMNNGILTDVKTDVKDLGTEETEFKVTLTMPEDIFGCEITVALLKQTETGLVPIGSSSYRPGRTDFLPIKSAKLGGKELTFDEYNETKVVVPPKTTEFPSDIFVETADVATKVDWEVYTGEDNYGLITASLPDGDAIEYRVNFVHANHYFVKAKTDDEFTEINSWSDWNMVSNEVIMNEFSEYRASGMPLEYGSKNDNIGKDSGLVLFKNYQGKVFTNLHGIDENHPELGGSRLFTNYPANYRQRHAINYVDPMYEGCDYLITSNGAMTTDQSVIYYDFDLAYDAEVVIITMSACTNYPKEQFVESTNKSGFIVGSYINLTYTNPLVNNFGISPLMSEVIAFETTAKGKLATDPEYFEACENLAASLTERCGREITAQQLVDVRMGLNEKDKTDLKLTASNGGNFTYKYAYTKKFKVPEGEESVNVKIKAPDKAQGRGFVVVIKPIEE